MGEEVEGEEGVEEEKKKCSKSEFKLEARGELESDRPEAY